MDKPAFKIKEFFISLIDNWLSLRKSMYFIVIKDIFLCHQKNQILIKYKYQNKRIDNTISIEDFMMSPLKHAVHPDQMLQIGMEVERSLSQLRKAIINNEDLRKIRTLKRVFYQ